jgi:hypothetical protein
VKKTVECAVEMKMTMSGRNSHAKRSMDPSFAWNSLQRAPAVALAIATEQSQQYRSCSEREARDCRAAILDL